jgi:hypothetical protein
MMSIRTAVELSTSAVTVSRQIIESTVRTARREWRAGTACLDSPGRDLDVRGFERMVRWLSLAETSGRTSRWLLPSALAALVIV